MTIPKKQFIEIPIEDLLINPENFRFTDAVADEAEAMASLFNGPNKESAKEMLVLANDIAENGFISMDRIAWFDSNAKKYLVIDGNRRMTCLKLMTIYKNNATIKSSFLNALLEDKIATTTKIFDIDLPKESFLTLGFEVYNDYDEALAVLPKIHQDFNGGLGRKPWDLVAKERANANLGYKSRAYSIINFVSNYPNANDEFLEKIKAKYWVSKLQRVVSFSIFQSFYGISFDSKNDLILKCGSDKAYTMMERLISDLIGNIATGKFRLKNDFKDYLQTLPTEYKFIETTLDDSHPSISDYEFSQNPLEEDNCNQTSSNSENSDDHNDDRKFNESEAKEVPEKDDKVIPNNEPTLPRKRSVKDKKHFQENSALRLSQDYPLESYVNLGEKGKTILYELESLDINDNGYAAACLCRSILEYAVNQWSQFLTFRYDSTSLESSFLNCITALQKKSLIENKQHSCLSTTVRKEKFIDSLNSWIHGDNLLAVRLETLQNGWKSCRIIIELLLKHINQKD